MPASKPWIPSTADTAATPWLLPPPQALAREAEFLDDVLVDEEEPEIIELLTAHCRALLQLRRLTAPQRLRLHQLLVRYEAWLAASGSCRSLEPDGANGAPPGALHDVLGCLTAIRLYAAAARRAVAICRRDLAEQAFGEVSLQVDRAQALLSAERHPHQSNVPPVLASSSQPTGSMHLNQLEALLESEVLQQEVLPLSARLVDLGLDAYMAGYHVASEHLFHLAERMMADPYELR